MDRNEIMEKIMPLLLRYSKSAPAEIRVGPDTSLVGDLNINSARLVDIVLDLEDLFGIRIEDRESDRVKTVSDVAGLIERKTAKV